MQRRFVLILTLVFCVLSCVTLTACKKDKSVQTDVSNEQQQTDEIEAKEEENVTVDADRENDSESVKGNAQEQPEETWQNEEMDISFESSEIKNDVKTETEKEKETEKEDVNVPEYFPGAY